jgi:hypothetical protein
MRSPRLLACLAVCVLIGTNAGAVDPWESAQDFSNNGDDDNDSNTTLSHGLVQSHDLDQAGGGDDQDWYQVNQTNHHSYEARISGTNIGFSHGACGDCAQFERVNAAGTIVQDDASVGVSGSYDRTIRWVATATTQVERIRVTGGAFFTENANSVYTIRFWDTTYAIPRWNNAGGQVTVFLVQSTIPQSVTGEIYFYNPLGTLLHTQPFTLAANQLFVFSTGTVPALAGTSGHAYVAHNGGIGGLSGKAVALESATGFSFDTPLSPLFH